jgi:hypothetical protein
MPLPLPHLDDRRWSDLVEEGRALIPRYAPQWTDHNVHDPGITLIELFAWLTEANIYRLNRITERHRRKFLGLLGFEPHQPRASRAVLLCKSGAGSHAFPLPAGTEFEAPGAMGETVPFRTLRDLNVAGVELAALQVDAGDGGIRDRTRDWREGLPLHMLGSTPVLGAALYLGFAEVPRNEPVALALRFQGPGNDDTERARISDETIAWRAAGQPVLPAGFRDDEMRQSGTLEETPPHHSAKVVWEIFTGDWTPLEPVSSAVRPAAGQVWDDTRSLTLDGIVEFNLPTTVTPTALGRVGDPLLYLRCRLVAGTHDAVPMLTGLAPNGVIAEQAVPVWQSFAIAAGINPTGTTPVPGNQQRLRMRLAADGRIHQLTFLEPEDAPEDPDVTVLSYVAPTATAPGEITLELVRIGSGHGGPAQRLTLPRAPIQLESFSLFTHDGAGWQRWTRRNDLDAAKRTDFCYELEPARGEIAFGNGERGQVVPAGLPILAAYRWTRADAANAPAANLLRLAQTPRNNLWPGPRPQTAVQMIRTRSGRAAETLPEATGRAVETLYAHERLLDLQAETGCESLDQMDRQRVRTLQAPSRAVNLPDIERLALEVPGTRVARARAWRDAYPTAPCLKAPGVITVIIVPDTPVARPKPTAGLLNAVRSYLDQRRILCTRLEIIGPEYLEVRVDAKVRTLPHTSTSRVRQAIVRTLNDFLDPRSGGPEGRGWPFGRDVYRSEIMQLIDGVPGVDHVLALQLGNLQGEAQCGNLSLCPHGLTTPGEHEIGVVRGQS